MPWPKTLCGTSRILASQAADELLDICGINASFVIYPGDDKETVFISARSIGQANVQVILEPLGAPISVAVLVRTCIASVVMQRVKSSK